jgi:hypothetical protein
MIDSTFDKGLSLDGRPTPTINIASRYIDIITSTWKRRHSASSSRERCPADIDAYIDTFQKAKQLGKGVVSFRH